MTAALRKFFNSATRRDAALIALVALIAATAAFFFLGLPWLKSEGLLGHGPFTGGGRAFVIAENMVSRGAYSTDFAPPYHPTARRTPLYPLFLAGLRALGASPLVILIIQGLLGLAVPLGTYALGRQFAGRKVALAAGLLMAVHPTHLLQTMQFADDWLFAATIYPAFAFFAAAVFKPEKKHLLAWSGFFIGLAILARPVPVLFWPVIAAAYFLAARVEIGWRAAARAVAVFCLVLALVVSPWLVRNYRDFGTFTVSPLDGFNLLWEHYQTYLTDRDGISKTEALARVRTDFSSYLKMSIHEPDESQFDSSMEPAIAAAAKPWFIARVARDPFGYAVSHLKHGLPFLTGSALREALGVVGIYPKTLWVSAPNFTDAVSRGRWGEVEKGLLTLGPWAALYAADFLAMTALPLLFATLALAVICRRGDRKKQLVAATLALFILYAFLLSSGTYIGPRYRYSVEPIIFILAFTGLALAVKMLRPKKIPHAS